MSKIKELVDKYLKEHQEQIQNLKDSGLIKWFDVAMEIAKENGYKKFSTKDGKLTLNPDYVRKRYLQIKNKCTIEPITVKELKGSNYSKVVKDKLEEMFNKTGTFNYISGKENKREGTKEFIFTADRIPTEDEIVKHFNIDTNKYKINQIWHKTTPSGKYSISVNLQALRGSETTNYESAFQTFLDRYNGTILSGINKPVKDNIVTNVLYLVTLADLHIGNYQKQDYIESIKNKVLQSFNAIKDSGVDKVVILNNGDMIHTDTSKNQTWNNTQLDAQDSYEDSFVNALDLVSSLIDYASSLSLSVTFVNVRGNHSFDTEYCMGEALKRIYKSNKNVEIINSKDTRIYYKWKNQGFLFTHGDKAVERLPLLFATEGKSVFAHTDNHHIILGHLHHNKGKQFVTDRGEFAGIEVRVVGSPTSNDIWHKQQGFCQNKKSIVSFLYSTEQGKYGEFNFKLSN